MHAEKSLLHLEVRPSGGERDVKLEFLALDAMSPRIIREPPVAELSREWPQAWAAREKLLQLRAAAGERLPPG